MVQIGKVSVLQPQVVFTSYIDFVCFRKLEWPLTFLVFFLFVLPLLLIPFPLIFLLWRLIRWSSIACKCSPVFVALISLNTMSDRQKQPNGIKYWKKSISVWSLCMCVWGELGAGIYVVLRWTDDLFRLSPHLRLMTPGIDPCSSEYRRSACRRWMDGC